jgi:DNA-binding MarR family transcriptional regulator
MTMTETNPAPARPEKRERHALPAALTDATGFLVNEVARILRERTASAVSSLDLRPRQLGILRLLRESGPMSQQEVGELLEMDRTTVMQLVGGLEAIGAVQRKDNPDDRRAYEVHLTVGGRRLAQQADRHARRVEREVLGVLSLAEQRTLKALLRTLLESQRHR